MKTENCRGGLEVVIEEDVQRRDGGLEGVVLICCFSEEKKIEGYKVRNGEVEVTYRD